MTDNHLERATEFYRAGRLNEALVEYLRVLDQQPDHVQALFAAAWLYTQAGQPEQAVAAYRRILEIQPGNAEALNALGALFHAHGALPQAVEYYRDAIRVQQDYVEAWNNLGGALQRLYLTDEAIDSYRQALRLAPANKLWELRIATLCRAVARSEAESAQYRQELLATLEQTAAAGFSASPDELVQVGPYPSYSLMYHGLDDRPLKEAFASLFAPCFPAPEREPRLTGSRRVGMVVTRSHEDLFVRSMAGVLRHMDLSEFPVTVVCHPGREQHISNLLDCPGVDMFAMPEQVSAAASSLQQAQFDILYFWEIATDPVNYFLPYYRLAPVQCTSWGIQVTSGITTVDYYLSSRLVEPDNAQAYYTEKLLCADTLLTYQYRAHLPATVKKRTDLGLSSDRHLYLFPQQMGKFHPVFDAMAGEILRRDSDGLLVILQGLWQYSAEQLRERLTGTIGNLIDQVMFLPRLDRDDLLCLVADAEVLLDPPHYGGVNSSYDGFSMNTPIVTLESPYHIGRYTAACYRKMGLDDLVASDRDAYVDMAVELGTNPAYRADWSRRIGENSGVLYEDAAAAREHERLFREMLQRFE